MKPSHRPIRMLALALALLWNCGQAAGNSEVLATVGPLRVTAQELEQAMRSAPFATRFNTLDEDQQAVLRGGLLQRLVLSRLLLLEARAQGLEQSTTFQQELQAYRRGLLHRRYMDRLRASIVVPEDEKSRMKAQFKGNYDAYKAAQSAYLADHYKQAHLKEIKRLRQHYRVVIHEEAIRPEATPETLLLAGDGIRIRYADLLDPDASEPTNTEWIRDRLYRRAELLLTAHAAEDAGIDVSRELAGYRDERLPALLMEQMEREWLPDEAPLRDYFTANPELGHVLGRRHIGQIVLATREEAETLRERIRAGASLFALAGEHSIDPYGREHKGDMGWIREDQGHPAIRAAIADLEDEAVSEIVETPLGFHLITILERNPGEDRPFEVVKDKVRQHYLAEHLQAYMRELEQKHRVVWHLPDAKTGQN